MLYYTIPYHTITYLVARANIQLAATEKEKESERDRKRYTEDNKLTRSNGIDKENKSDNSLSLSLSPAALPLSVGIRFIESGNSWKKHKMIFI